MISNEDRRAIVKKLRYTANDDLGGLSLQKNLATITKAEDSSWRGVMRRLADLIDVPSCHNVSDDEELFECSECGQKMPTFDGDSDWIPVSYCSVCGRKVVRDGD